LPDSFEQWRGLSVYGLLLAAEHCSNCQAPEYLIIKATSNV